jgi:tetratricopeptide (TPR) repeat protein
VLAQLELSWGDPRAAWNGLRSLVPDSAGIAVWREFGERAEAAEAWTAARDAFTAAAVARQDGEMYARAARDALRAGDPKGADTLAALAMQHLDSAFATGVAVPARVEALSQLGRGAEAARIAAAYARWTAPDERTEMARRVAWAWVRAGDIPKARAALEAAGADAGEAGGWLALYDGDLAAARRGLKPERARTADELAAAALLGRTTGARAPTVGKAFLALARADTAAAARDFEKAALELPDAAPLLLSLAARLDAARGEDAAAIALWKRILDQSPQSPEAPASELEWARALRRDHKDAEAVTRLEHLILTYPESALLPQARRELDAARHALPVAS